MADVNVTVKKSGPYLVSGAITLVDHEGTPYTLEKDTVALCRCGLSANRPFCDGTHAREGFSAEEHAG